MAVPTDPTPDFVAGTVINPDLVDARFLALYRALDPAADGIDNANIKAAANIDGSKLAAATVPEDRLVAGALGRLKGVVSVTAAAAQSRSNGEIVQFEAEDHDYSNWWNVNGLQPTIACVVEVFAQVSVSTATTDQWVRLAIHKNGGVLRRGPIMYQRGSGQVATVQAQVPMNGAADFLDVRFLTNAVGAQALGGGAVENYLTAKLLGRT